MVLGTDSRRLEVVRAVLGSTDRALEAISCHSGEAEHAVSGDYADDRALSPSVPCYSVAIDMEMVPRSFGAEWESHDVEGGHKQLHGTELGEVRSATAAVAVAVPQEASEGYSH